jgi:cytochrome d ubiquinol oxidase subunit I
MDVDASALILHRVQFAVSVALHIIFPAFTIGLASYLVVLEAQWLRTKDDVYRRLYDFWVRVFAVSFGLGVVSGVVLSYQFGTNWSVLSERAGPILGPLLAYEGLTAFFLEAGFLGVMLFGRDKVGPKLHFFATLMVAVGTLISAFWILSANSWMQTPAGHIVRPDGVMVPESWWNVIFNPSFPYRMAHMTLAAFLTTALVVGAVAAWHMLRGSIDPAVRRMFAMSVGMIAVVAPLQIVAGDLHGLNTLEHQPIKIAAMEGLYETTRGAPFALFGIPDDETGRLRAAIEIPNLASLILTHEWNGEVRGLHSFPVEQRPSTSWVFYAFRVMILAGLIMLVLGLVGTYLWWKGRLYASRGFQRFALACGPLGFIAVIAGWIVTEVGRQPFVVYGLLRTAEAVSPVGAAQVSATLTMIAIVYLMVYGAGTLYLIRMFRVGPALPADERTPIPAPGPNRPLSAADVAIAGN